MSDKVVTEKGTGVVRLATASEQDQATDKKTVFEGAKKAHAKAKQAFAEAEVAHYTKLHQEKVDPDDLAKSRENVDACYAAYMETKKASVKAEADTYDDDKKTSMAKAAFDDEKAKADAEAKAAAEAEATAKAEAEAKAKADFDFKAKQKEEDDAKAAATAKAAADAEAAAKAEAEAKAAAKGGDLHITHEAGAAAATEKMIADAIAKATAPFQAKVDELEKKLATASAAPKVTVAAAAEPAHAGPTGDGIARATISFSQKDAADGKKGSKIVVLGGKAANGGNLAIASEASKTLDLSGLFRGRA